MTKNMAKVLFVLRTTKSKQRRQVLYCRVTVNQLTREFSTEEFLQEPELWNQETQRYEKDGPEGEYLNLMLDKLRYDLKSISLSLSHAGPVMPWQIIEQFKTPPEQPVPLREILRDYITYSVDELGRSAGTVRHYENFLKNLMEFETRPVFANEVTLPWAEKFKSWLRKERGCKKTRPSRHVEFFNRAMKYAIKQGKIKENGLLNYTIERDPNKPVTFLTKEQAMLWVNANFKNKTLRECTHLFIYQFTTGVEYGNIWGKFEIKDVPGAGRLIMGHRGKNKNPFFVPYDEMAEAILTRYNGVLPYYDNSTYNKTIRIIAEFLGIEQHLTSHTARKTFSMSKEVDGWPRECIMSMLGHTSIRTTETYYLTASADRVINEMARRK